MGLDPDQKCPECGATEFWRTASTLVTLGQKVKWQCADCEYGFVTIDSTVNTSTA